MKKFKVRIYKRYNCDAVIEEVEVERETDSSVWIKGSRVAKRSEYANYYSSWDDAHVALLSRQLRYAGEMRDRHKRAEKILEDIKNMSKEGLK